MHKIYELKEMLCEELEEYGGKEKLDVGSLDVVDKLAHAIKNLDKIIESYEESEYSGNYEDGGMSMEGGRSYARGGRSYREGSYAREYSRARGRGSNARRDSMGRYSRADITEELRDIMDKMPDDHSRMKIQKIINEM